MKTFIKHTVSVLAAIVGMSVNAAFTYNPNDKTLSDGVWTFTATLVRNTTDKLDVTGTNGSFAGSRESTIDLTTITDSDGNVYDAVSFSGVPSAGAKYLTEFIAPKCETIGAGSFRDNCTSLKKVELSSQSEQLNLKDRAFWNCSKLEEFIPSTLNVSSISIGCFYGCSSLSGELSLPKCTGIGDSAFRGCGKITSVSMPHVVKVGTYAFENCTSLETVITSEALKEIPMAAFKGCRSLSGDSIRGMLHPGITKLGSSYALFEMFNGCSNLDGEIEWNFPNLTTTNVVGNSCFKDCTRLEKVTFLTFAYEIRPDSFVNLAPGAKIYLHETPPSILHPKSIGNVTVPFSKVYLNEKNMIEGLAKIAEGYHVLLKKDFNNRNWTDYAVSSLRTRDHLVESYMKKDTSMCQYDEEKKEVELSCPEQREVIAFCVPRVSGAFQTNWPSFWLMKTTKSGLSVIVR